MRPIPRGYQQRAAASGSFFFCRDDPVGTPTTPLGPTAGGRRARPQQQQQPQQQHHRHSTLSTDTRTASVASPAYFKCEYGLSELT